MRGNFSIFVLMAFLIFSGCASNEGKQKLQNIENPAPMQNIKTQTSSAPQETNASNETASSYTIALEKPPFLDENIDNQEMGKEVE